MTTATAPSTGLARPHSARLARRLGLRACLACLLLAAGLAAGIGLARMRSPLTRPVAPASTPAQSASATGLPQIASGILVAAESGPGETACLALPGGADRCGVLQLVDSYELPDIGSRVRASFVRVGGRDVIVALDRAALGVA